MTKSTDQLRTLHRTQRAALDASVQQRNAASLHARLEQLPQYLQARHIAAYIAIRGEIDLGALLSAGATRGKQFYLPVLSSGSMYFVPWNPEQELVKKGFGLLEPDVPVSECIEPEELDLVLAPLVVFDPQRNRIGQGGGYYDKTFAHRISKPQSRPVLLGVAHQSQCEAQLQPQSWDVPLDLVVTDTRVYSP